MDYLVHMHWGCSEYSNWREGQEAILCTVVAMPGMQPQVKGFHKKRRGERTWSERGQFPVLMVHKQIKIFWIYIIGPFANFPEKFAMQWYVYSCILRPCLVSNFFFRDTVVLSFICSKYCLIIDKLGSKDLSCDLQANCIISFFFCLYLMFHACAARFYVTGNLEKVFDFWMN